MHHDRTDKGAYLTFGVLLGAAVGMVAGLLTAPRSGNETREKLRSRANDMHDHAKDKFEEKREMAEDKIQHALDKSKHAASRAADNAKDVVDKTADRARRAADKAQANVEDMQNRNM